MGVNISSWHLARTVSTLGGLGTVSGVAVEILVMRLLQQGDQGGHFRRALDAFPFQSVADRIRDAYFFEGGIGKGESYKVVPKYTVSPRRELIELTVFSAFALVWLAKEGHKGVININFLEKIQMPLLYGIYGAMLAGVDYITVGAGIPLQIPKVLDAYATEKPATYRINVTGLGGGYVMSCDPKEIFGDKTPSLSRPGFFPIASSNTLATKLVKNGGIDGLIIEKPIAGGHNAPARKDSGGNFLPDGRQDYGPKDEVDLQKIKYLGVPFWIAGGHASPEALKNALDAGANGIQVGSIFALCEDSGMDPSTRRELRRQGYLGELIITTDLDASPTGYPFKVAQLLGTVSDAKVYGDRDRICSQWVLVEVYLMPNGKIGYRCASEPLLNFERKGGDMKRALKAKCLCNGLLATAKVGDPGEPRIVTLGDKQREFLNILIKHPGDAYNAKQVFAYLLGE
jgi:nitronate monooxygenase